MEGDYSKGSGGGMFGRVCVWIEKFVAERRESLKTLPYQSLAIAATILERASASRVSMTSAGEWE